MNFARSSLVAGCRRIFARTVRALLEPKSPRRRVSFAAAAVSIALCCATTASVGAADETELARGFTTDVKPLVAKYCAKCHSEDLAEAEVNLADTASIADARKDLKSWGKVAEMLDGQMPPRESPQPTDAERTKLKTWVKSFLKEEAKRDAGDPGPVVLRRLNNAEYTYVLRDLTGVKSLSPAAEFPVDGAAGEGFTNTGNALAMSPALLTKYLDAAKDVSQHMVLLPDGVRFSSSTTRRDWTEEVLADIRRLYAIYSDSQGGTQVNLQGIVFDTNGGGRLPVERYLAATLAERDALAKGTKTIDTVARERSLSPKYLGLLWNELTKPADTNKPGAATPQSMLLDALRTRWKTAQPNDASALAAEVARWQIALWKFTSVGHIGKVGGPKAWMEPVNPLVASQELRMKLPAATDGKDVVLYLSAGDAGDGNQNDFALWGRPRLVAPGRPDILLRDVAAVTRELETRRRVILSSVANCLDAAAEASGQTGEVALAPLAAKHGVDPDALAGWLQYLGIGVASGPAKVGAPITRQMPSGAGYDFIKGWVGDDALSVVANSSDQTVRIPGTMVPHSVAVHPAPTIQVVIGWRAPVAGKFRVGGFVQHAHHDCGNGVAWTVEIRRGNTRQRLAAGNAQGPPRATFGPLENIAMNAGDFVTLVINPRDRNHSCDLTQIDLTFDDGQRKWGLASDVSPQILAGNPHADSHGNANVWHFNSEPDSGSSGHVVPADSLLAQWQSATDGAERKKLAAQIQQLLAGELNVQAKSPNDQLRAQLTSLGGPLLSAALQSLASKPDLNKPDATATKPDASKPASEKPAAEKSETPKYGLDAALFGKHPSGGGVEPASLCVQAPTVVEVRLPAELAAGAEFVTTATLHAESGKEGSVQMQLTTTKPESAAGLQPTTVAETRGNGPWTSNNRGISHGTPIICVDGSDTRKRIERALDEFRQLFPAALCYTKIVPVDEVVTLTLFYREDDHLRRLMLSADQIARIDRLWDELHFISQDALTLVDAYEQLWQYATQDADPKVFEPLRKPIMDRAAAFRNQMKAAEPKQLAAVIALASNAYRRPVTDAERSQLEKLYLSLRQQELNHEDAVRLVLARIFVSPAFLYRAEKPAMISGSFTTATPASKIGVAIVDDHDLANRLSFFLWSTGPDSELRKLADDDRLWDDPALVAAQSKRMLGDPRVRRMATEFFCQWLHIYDFDSHDEKSPATFPTFSALRGPMYEESIQFFTDLLQRDGSVLSLIDCDHTFLNEELAKHYGISGVSGPEWRRVDGLKKYGRGGILGMATTLSKQAGASRTSPILRGNWLSEVVLGDKLPKPPKGVPQLPDVVPAGLTERQLIEQHSVAPDCAKCHARIDPFGFALENFDGIGRWRGRKLGTLGAANPAPPPAPAKDEVVYDTKTKLPDGTPIDGLEGLREYLLTKRRDDFIRQFNRKLLGYALGRAVQLSDEPLLEEMHSQLKANDYRIGVAIDAIVRSQQFRKIRTND